MGKGKKVKIIEFNDDALCLFNSGYLSIFFLGTGSAFSRKLFQNNIVIIKNRTSIFVDFGTKAPISLDNVGLNVSNIEHLIITHSHADHIGGVEEIALMNRYLFNKKPNLYITKEYSKKFWNESLAGGCKYNEMKGKKVKHYLSLSDYFKVHYFKECEVNFDKDNRKFYRKKIGDIDIFLFQTKHIPSNYSNFNDFHLSYGLVIDSRIIFTSDTIFDPDLLYFLMGKFNIEYIFHDCQLFYGGVHASYEELLTLPSEIREKIFLMHYGDNFSTTHPEKDGFAGFAKQYHFYNFY